MAGTLIGSVVGGHRIDRLIGRGGMGLVFEAVELGLERTVALKLIAPELAGDPAFRERFMTESKVAASIDHPNVLPIFRAGEDEGVLFLAMRLVAGDDLRTIVDRDGPLAPERAAAVVAQVGSALDVAHARRLIHRDVKPANVLIAGEHAYLTDFGLVKDVGATAADTRTGEVLGTLDYVAPERIRGGVPGPSSDVYSLGCLLFYLLAGRVVFPVELPESKLWAHVSEPPPAVSEAVSGVPAAFDDVVRRAMAKDPADRYPTASALGEAALQAAATRTRGDHGLSTSAAGGRGERALQAALEHAGRGSSAAALEAGRLAGAVRQAVARADRLRPAAVDVTAQDVERRLAEIRSGRALGKAQSMDAFAHELAARRRSRAQLEAFDRAMEGIVGMLEGLAGELGQAEDEAVAATLRLLGTDVRTAAACLTAGDPVPDADRPTEAVP